MASTITFEGTPEEAQELIDDIAKGDVEVVVVPDGSY